MGISGITRRLAVCFVCMMIAFCATPSLAIDYHWQGAGTGGNTATDPSDATTLWNDPGNWLESGFPGSIDTARLAFENAGYANVETGEVLYLYVDGTSLDGKLHIADTIDFTVEYRAYLGYNAFGAAIQTGGTLSINESLYLGYAANSSGTYELGNGELAIDDYEYIGYSGSGTFTQTGGTHSVSYSLYLGHETDSSGTYELGNGDLAVNRSECIGYNGSGTFTQTGGTHSVNWYLYLGHETDSEGTYALTDGTMTVGLVFRPRIKVG